MRRVLPFILFLTNVVCAMQQEPPKPQKVYLRVIAHDKQSSDCFMSRVKARRALLTKNLLDKGNSPNVVQNFVDECIIPEFWSECGLMKGFVGKRWFMEPCITDLRTMGFRCSSHDQGANYERFVFINSQELFLEAAFLGAKRKSTKVSLSGRRNRDDDFYDFGPLMVCIKRQKDPEQNSPMSVVSPVVGTSSTPCVKNKPCLSVATPNGCSSEKISIFYKCK